MNDAGAKAPTAGEPLAAAQPPAAGGTAPPSIATIAVRGPLGPILLAPSIVAIAHWNRLMGGLLYAASPRLPWSQLLRRTFAKDVEQCPKCHGRLRLIQSIAEPGVPTPSSTGWASCPHETPTAARARDPTDDDARNDDDDDT